MFTLFARHGRLMLVIGLAGGVFLPGLAQALKPWLPEMVAVLLFLTAFRIGAQETLGQVRDMRQAVIAVLLLQCALPVAVAWVVVAIGAGQVEAVVIFVMLLAAPSVTAASNMAILFGHSPAPGLRILIVGTALVPLTILPVLWLLPTHDNAAAILYPALKLLVTIAVAVAVGFGLRHLVARDPDPRTLSAMDGATILALAVIVIGLMSAFRPTLDNDPAALFGWLGFALVANFGMQLTCRFLLGPILPTEQVVPLSIVAGNRNLALFIVALPEAMSGPWLLFLACYQIPMYLTPIVMRPFFQNRGADSS